MDGILNIYKEKGYTSHDVVARLRGICKQKRIGHTGTLDPDAEGVLPICLGKATKLCSLLTDKSKEYQAVMELGITTDTQDMSGNVLSVKKVEVDNVTIIDTIMSFVGEYSQIPPMYSAIKVHGRKLYELARQGIEIEREPRKIEIFAININDISDNSEFVIDIHGELVEKKTVCVSFDVRCSKGTYIRTLCHDIGEKLGCGACMKTLLRTEASGFNLSDSRKLEDIEKMKEAGTLEDFLVSIDECLNYPHIYVTESGENALRNGNYVSERDITQNGSLTDGQKYLFYTSSNDFIAVYRYDAANKRFTADKMFI